MARVSVFPVGLAPLLLACASQLACSSGDHRPAPGTTGSRTDLPGPHRPPATAATDPGAARATSPAPASADPRTPAAADPTNLPCDGSARALGPGLVHERWPVAGTAALDLPPCLDLVRADLRVHRLRLLTAARDGHARPAPDWMADTGLVAVINAGMFHDGGGPVGLLVDGDHVGNPDDNRKFGGYLAWNPTDRDAPPAVVAGRGCPGFDLADLRRRYRTVIQSYRLLGCDGDAIPWADPKSYSAAALGLDRQGRVVLVHVRTPFRMTALARALARPELDLAGMLFVEGGPEASLFATGRDATLARVGSYEDGFFPDDSNRSPWSLPNVVGLAPRTP